MFLYFFFVGQLLGLTYLTFSLKRRFSLNSKKTIYLAAYFLVYLVSHFLAYKLRNAGTLAFRSLPIQIFYYFSYISFTLIIFALVYLVILDGIEWIYNKKNKNTDLKKREFFKKSLQFGLAGGVLSSTTLGVVQAKSGPEYKFIEIPVDHPEMEGLTIAQISDLHVGPLIDRSYVQDTVDRVNAQKVDLVVLTGDLVDGSPEQLMGDMAPLKDLQSRLGIYGCLGNHELYSGLYDWLPQFESLNIRMLNNEHIVIDSAQRSFVLAGVTDPHIGRAYEELRPNAKKAIQGAPAHFYKIVLAHQPSACFETVEAGFDLQLSGHTHGGQFFPFNLVISFFHPYVRGLNRHKEKMWVYVNSATGYWGPPNRLAVPAEITIFSFKFKPTTQTQVRLQENPTENYTMS